MLPESMRTCMFSIEIGRAPAAKSGDCWFSSATKTMPTRKTQIRAVFQRFTGSPLGTLIELKQCDADSTRHACRWHLVANGSFPARQHTADCRFGIHLYERKMS